MDSRSKLCSEKKMRALPAVPRMQAHAGVKDWCGGEVGKVSLDVHTTAKTIPKSKSSFRRNKA